jgi:diguanylate cyclase (GGDEF)-like protein
MHFKTKFYITVLISFIFLSYSIYIDNKYVNTTNNIIKSIEAQLSTSTDESINKKVLLLKNTNDERLRYTLYIFMLAFLLILIAMYKLSKHDSETEKEISKKTEELYLKTNTHILSGLPNRNKFFDDSYIYKFKQMALLNIDKFQKFNDVYGEEIGNIALKLTAEFLSSKFNDKNTVLYHIGGDEFIVATQDSTKLNNTHFIEKIEDILKMYKKENFVYEDKTFTFMMSAGLAFSGSNKMLAYADMALKDAKKRNVQMSIFNDDKELEISHKEDIEYHSKLLFALENKNIITYFQPIAPIQNSSLDIKYESLVRIIEEDGNAIPPFKFIDVAKQNRIYHKVTRAVVENTLNKVSKYKVPCSFNLSMEDIENNKTVEMLYEIFDDYNYNNLLTIELLETEELKDYNFVYDFCLKIRSYGIKIALDDFGAGYSNFSHVLNLPIDFIKIDASLISNIDRDVHSQIMVETIVSLAKKLNIYTIAEFVSSKEILDVVKRLDVDYAQGFYIGKPDELEIHLPYL